jgi:hypothetical protein
MLSNEIILTTLYELHEKDQWWLNELRSPGIEVNKRNEFNDIKEISNLANNLKKCYFHFSFEGSLIVIFLDHLSLSH